MLARCSASSGSALSLTNRRTCASLSLAYKAGERANGRMLVGVGGRQATVAGLRGVQCSAYSHILPFASGTSSPESTSAPARFPSSILTIAGAFLAHPSRTPSRMSFPYFASSSSSEYFATAGHALQDSVCRAVQRSAKHATMDAEVSAYVLSPATSHSHQRSTLPPPLFFCFFLHTLNTRAGL